MSFESWGDTSQRGFPTKLEQHLIWQKCQTLNFILCNCFYSSTSAYTLFNNKPSKISAISYITELFELFVRSKSLGFPTKSKSFKGLTLQLKLTRNIQVSNSLVLWWPRNYSIFMVNKNIIGNWRKQQDQSVPVTLIFSVIGHLYCSSYYGNSYFCSILFLFCSTILCSYIFILKICINNR